MRNINVQKKRFGARHLQTEFEGATRFVEQKDDVANAEKTAEKRPVLDF